MLDREQVTDGAIPRPPARLITAPLQLMAGVAAISLREPRGKEETL
jgi:hypothetical protein